MITPRPYLSFSQMVLFEDKNGEEKYADRYLYNKPQRTSRNMAYGSMLADGLEAEEATGDPLLDLMASRLPKFELMDKPIEVKIGRRIWFERDKEEIYVPVLLNVNKKGEADDIPLLALPDTAKPDYTAFKEYKTSVRKWTQRMADDSGQITFYVTVIWLATGKIPQDIELVNVQVGYEPDGRLQPTGEMWRFPTKRSMIDIIKMTGRMKRTWAGIKKLCEKELL